MTKLAVAKAMGLSERHLHRMLRAKTASRERAEQLAHHLGGVPGDYLRAARPRGRQPHASNYPFASFIAAFGAEISEDIGMLSQLSDAFLRAFAELERKYEHQQAPHDFESFEHFLGFMERADFCGDSQRQGLAIWRRFRIWRVQQECAERIFAIEIGDDVS